MYENDGHLTASAALRPGEAQTTAQESADGQPEVPAQLAALDGQLETLGQMLDGLIMHLEPVRLIKPQEAPDPIGAPPIPLPGRVAARIGFQINLVQRFLERISQLRSELEI